MPSLTWLRRPLAAASRKGEMNVDLQKLLDRAAIADLLALYCRGVDRMDEATLRSIYHEDAIEDRGEGLFVGNAQQWVGWTLRLLPAFKATQHAIQNILIEIDGDTAYSETYFQAYHRFGKPDHQAVADGTGTDIPEDVAWPEGETEMIMGGRYLDKFSRRNGIWKISYRKMINDWCRTQPAADDWFRSNPTAYLAVRHLDDSRLDSELHPTHR